MERIYRHETGYVVVREHADGDFTTYLFDDECRELLNDRKRSIGGTYKTLETALRYAAKKAGASNPEPWEATTTEGRYGLTLIGTSEQGKAGGIMQADARRDEVGLWHLSVSVKADYEYVGECHTTTEVSEFRTEEEAWEAYEAVSLRATCAYEADKHLTHTVLVDCDWSPVREYIVASEHYSGWAHHPERKWNDGR